MKQAMSGASARQRADAALAQQMQVEADEAQARQQQEWADEELAAQQQDDFLTMVWSKSKREGAPQGMAAVHVPSGGRREPAFYPRDSSPCCCYDPSATTCCYVFDLRKGVCAIGTFYLLVGVLEISTGWMEGIVTLSQWEGMVPLLIGCTVLVGYLMPTPSQRPGILRIGAGLMVADVLFELVKCLAWYGRDSYKHQMSDLEMFMLALLGVIVGGAWALYCALIVATYAKRVSRDADETFLRFQDMARAEEMFLGQDSSDSASQPSDHMVRDDGIPEEVGLSNRRLKHRRGKSRANKLPAVYETGVELQELQGARALAVGSSTESSERLS